MLAKRVFFNKYSIGTKITMALGICIVYGVFLYTQGANPFLIYYEMFQATLEMYMVLERLLSKQPLSF